MLSSIRRHFLKLCGGLCLFSAGLAPGYAQLAGSGVGGTLPEDYFPELRQILLTALHQSPTMLDQAVRVTQAEAAHRQAAAPLYPQVGLGGSYSGSKASSDSSGTASTSSTSGLNYGLSLSQPLFQWGALRANAEIGRLGETLAQRNREEISRGLLGTLRSQYLGLVIKQATLRRADFRMELADRDLADLVDRINRGVSARGEQRAMELAAQRARLSRDGAREELENALRIFRRISGQAELNAESIPSELPPPQELGVRPGALRSTFLRTGLEATPQALALEVQRQQSDLSYKVAKTGQRPKFKLTTGYNSGSNTYVDGLGRVSQSVVASRTYGVGLDWNLIDGGATRSATRAALANRRLIERQIANYNESTRDEVIHRERQLALDAQALAVSETERALGEANLRLQREYLASGQAAPIDVDRARALYEAAELASFSYRAAFILEWSDFVSLVGADPMMNLLPATNPSHGQ